MSFPKEVTRITTHKKPKHQLYQPGFNDDNGCWLEGAWVTVTPAQYEARKTEHEAWYGKIRSAKQHYRDPAVPFEKMTPAQKQAFSHFSGQGVVYCRGAEGGVGPVYIELTADKIRQDSVDWFKATGRKILKVVKMPDGTLVDQKVQFSVPDEVVEVEEGEAPDPWKEIVKQNKEREDQMMDAFLGGPPDGLGGLPGMDGFSMGDMVDQMAVHSLIRLEESIIRDEFSLSRGAPAHRYNDLDGDRTRYVSARQKVRAKFGDRFVALYKQAQDGHNECARINLDNSNGLLYCYVVPVFRDDGTHEPWGERDVPWAQEAS